MTRVDSKRPLSHCIRQDGDDAVHDGSVGEDEAADLQELANGRHVGRRARSAWRLSNERVELPSKLRACRGIQAV